MVPEPMKLATFCDTPFFSSVERYSASVVQVTSYRRSPWPSFILRFISGVSGPIEEPSPMIWVVTPCRTSPCDRPSTSRESVDHDNMLMKPGATARPLASTRRPAVAAARSPTAAIRSPRRPTSVTRAGAPVPS
jgi:hypothetical protein